MNNILFKIAELEEKFRNSLEVGGPIDRLVSEAQLKTLDIFKSYPVTSQQEANELLQRMNLVFGM